ncbi:hypothetical protein JCM10908_001948 [Rhodotorula pacifica]|uniref:uncharacterized protein n=1 Tax=Rhodotorula pacifica TaxID=1495444 RepID=UPI00316D6E0F
MSDKDPNSSEAPALSETPLPPGSILVVSSDGHHVPMDRLLLAANSSVFRDMFGTATEDQEQPCTVSETKQELLLLDEAMKGKAPKEEKEWLAVYNMMDKYDMPIIRPALLLPSVYGSSSLCAFDEAKC